MQRNAPYLKTENHPSSGKVRFLYSALAILFCLATQCTTSYHLYDTSPEQVAVREDFNQFKKLFNSRNEREILPYISTGTAKEATQTKALALNGTKSQIQRLPVSQQYELYYLRHTLEKSELSKKRPREVYVYLLNTIYTPILIHLGPIKVQGNLAAAKTVQNNKATPYEIAFVKENNIWKPRRELQRALVDSGYHVLRENLGESYERIFAVTLTEKTGRKPSPSIFK